MARSVHFRTTDLNGRYTEGSISFDPDKFLDPTDASQGTAAAEPFLAQDDFRGAVVAAFGLSIDDNYTYHAIASVSLDQIQSAVKAGSVNGLHDWYFDGDGQVLANPSVADIDAYLAVFAPGTAVASALASFAANAKKDTRRKNVGLHLLSKRQVDASFQSSKKKKQAIGHANPALDFWAWTCHALEWAGPTEHTTKVKTAHHLLPAMMHHFGCVTPSEEAFQMLSKAASGNAASRNIVEIGSGNGYWTLMLRHRGLPVTAVDNQQSVYRTMWIDDTVKEDGIRWLRLHRGGRDHVLLLVYPITAEAWTAKLLSAYAGDTICIAGTQNDNRYTGFSNETIESWMMREKPQFQKMVQIPLPSFAGKDEALFIYQRANA